MRKKLKKYTTLSISVPIILVIFDSQKKTFKLQAVVFEIFWSEFSKIKH